MSKYCSYCGAEISDESNFCNNCGKKQQKNEFDKEGKSIKERSNMSYKDKLISDLKKAREYFKGKQASYDDFDKLLNEKKEIFRPSGFSLFIFGIILAFMAYFFLTFNSYKTNDTLFFIMMFIGGVVFPIFLSKRTKTNANKKTTFIDQGLKKIESELTVYFNDYPNSPVSFKYSNPKIIDVLIENISSGRAETVKEAINCMLDDLHKQRMEKKQDEISKDAKKAADSAEFAALFSAGTFLKKKK